MTTTFQGTSDTPPPTHPTQCADQKVTFKNTLLLGERSENQNTLYVEELSSHLI